MPKISVKACGAATKGSSREYDRVLLLGDVALGTPTHPPGTSNEHRRDEAGAWDAYPLERVCGVHGLTEDDIAATVPLDELGLDLTLDE